MSEEYNPHDKVYRAGDKHFSILELLNTAISPEYSSGGLPRIADFHLKVGEPVHFRYDEYLRMIPNGEPITQEIAERLIFPLLADYEIEALTLHREDVDASYQLAVPEDGGAFNFRINAFYDRDGLAAVIRLLPPKVPPVSTLGFPTDQVWEDIVQLKQGLILVTGVTGSGKSTTIASMLNYINENSPVRVITLEDPVEFIFKSKVALFSQREVGKQVETFSKGLRSALRENPDIIFVGEIRDPETAALVMTAAETGHLVFATMHTRDVVGAITRIIDMFPASRTRELTTQLAFSLVYLISQKLVPYENARGRCVAMEVLKNVAGVSTYLRTMNFAQLYSFMETKPQEGMITLEQSLLKLYKDGLISREQAIINANRDSIIEKLPPQ